MPPFSRIKFYSGMEGKYFCAGSWTGERGKREGASTRPSGLLSVSALCFPSRQEAGETASAFVSLLSINRPRAVCRSFPSLFPTSPYGHPIGKP